MKYFVAVFMFFSIVFSSCNELKEATSSASTNTAVPGGVSTIELEIHMLINKYRESKRLPALKYNGDIMIEARKHSADMADGRVAFGHGGFDARAKRLQAKISNFRGIAENVAFGQRSAAEVVDGWIKSPGHKANIEGNYALTGIGVVANKKGVLYYTQIFVR